MNDVDTGELAREIETIAALEEPVRRRLYQFVTSQTADVSRDEAARAAGISRSLAAFHLDKLVQEGLLDAVYRRLTGRGGPGAGRPSKLYRRSRREIHIALPPRSYELAARLFARALDQPDSSGTAASLEGVARDFGRESGLVRRGEGGASQPPVDRLRAALKNCGYEPVAMADGAIRLRNCPFHALAREHRVLVCEMNLRLLEGLVEGLDAEQFTAVLDPQPDMCCVAFHHREADPARS